MSDLPDRDDVRQYMESGFNPSPQFEESLGAVLADYAAGVLKSRDDMDEEAAARMLALLVGVTMPDALAQDIAMKVVRAAWGEVADE